MGLSEQMLRMSGIGGLHLGPLRWQGKTNGKSVPPVEATLPLQQVSILLLTLLLKYLCLCSRSVHRY